VLVEVLLLDLARQHSESGYTLELCGLQLHQQICIKAEHAEGNCPANGTSVAAKGATYKISIRNTLHKIPFLL
jgi:hypothetical protein